MLQPQRPKKRKRVDVSTVKEKQLDWLEEFGPVPDILPLERAKAAPLDVTFEQLKQELEVERL